MEGLFPFDRHTALPTEVLDLLERIWRRGRFTLEEPERTEYEAILVNAHRIVPWDDAIFCPAHLKAFRSDGKCPVVTCEWQLASLRGKHST